MEVVSDGRKIDKRYSINVQLVHEFEIILDEVTRITKGPLGNS